MFLSNDKFEEFVRNLNRRLMRMETGVSGYSGLVEGHHASHEEGGDDMLSTGIADTDLIKVDGDPADDEFARWTASGLEGRTYAEVLADVSGEADATFDWNDQRLENVLSLEVKNLSVDTDDDYLGLENHHKKTAGASDADDDFYAHDNYVALDQVGGTIGYLSGFYTEAWLIDGTISHDLEAIFNKVVISGGVVSGDAIGSTDYIVMNGGSVDNLFGHVINLDVAAALTISGDVYGHYIQADIDTDPTGDVYMVYLKEYDNVDYGFYQDGSAANIFGGTIQAATGSTIGNLTLANGSITDSSGAISFGNENLSTTGIIAASTAKLSDLTPSYIPYHVGDAYGLADSILRQAGVTIGINKLPTDILHVYYDDSAIEAGIKIESYLPSLKFLDYSGSADDYQILVNLNTFYIKHDAGDDGTFENTRLLLDANGNFGFNQLTFGTNATKTLALGTGVAPTTSPADSFQMYSADIVAGNAAPHFRVEAGDIIKLYKYIDADFGNAIDSGDADTDDAISAIIAALTAHGLIAAA